MVHLSDLLAKGLRRPDSRLQEPPAEDRFDFDALAKDMAGGLSRREALRRVGAAIGGALLTSLGLSGHAWGVAKKDCSLFCRQFLNPERKQCVDQCLACPSLEQMCGASCGCTGGKICSFRTCVCPSDTTDCGGVCFNLQTSLTHCGGCASDCTQVFGATACCGGLCTDTDSSPLHCGGCGQSCAPGEACCSGVCTDLASDAENCGACTNACPGPAGAAACVAGACDQACQGESYDVDGDPSNGCEVTNPSPVGHTQQTATDLGRADCSPAFRSFSGMMLSDGRVHQNPSVPGFDPVVGAAPDYWTVFAEGGTFCLHDYEVTISTSGGGSDLCYRLTVVTDSVTRSVAVSGSGTAMLQDSGGAYSDNRPIYFKIEKICPLPVQEAVAYTVSFHL